MTSASPTTPDSVAAVAPHRYSVRPGLAIISNCLTPYRVYLHQQIAARLPEVQLHTIVTHGVGDFSWQMEIPAEINLVDFSEPGDSSNHHFANSLNRWARERRKARRLAEYCAVHNVAAAIGTINWYPSHLLLVNKLWSRGVKFFVNSDSNIHNERHMSQAKRWLKRRYYHWWLARTAGVMSMGRCGDEFFAQYWTQTDRVYRLPYWPDFEFFSRKDAAAGTAFRQKVGLAPNRRAMLFSGRLIAIKGIDLLIDAFARLSDRRPDWDLVIVGAGPLEQELRQHVPERLRERVLWSGFLDAAELVAAYHAAELVVVPSRFEPWAVVVQEALAAGRPVIASDIVGAAHELVIDGRNGRIFPSDDLTALTTALLDVSDDNQLPAYQSATKPLLEDWMRRANPIPEVRRALADAGVLPHHSV